MNPKTARTFLRTRRAHRRHTLRRHILCAGIASLLLLPGHAAGVLLHDYQFSGTFADSLGGPALVPLGGTGTFSATNYSFAAGQGLSLSFGMPAAGDYSIVADFSFASPSGYRKIVDFKTQTSDTGLYSLGSSLNFYPVVSGSSGAFASNVALNLALTRDGATNQVTGYVNGAQHITFADSGSLAVFTGASNEVRLFIDDNATGGREASAGTVHRVRIFNGALTPAQLAALLAAPAPATFWKGTNDGTWTGTNWASDAAGTPTAAIPNATSDITFSATGAMNRTTTLGADFTIKSLTISDPFFATINSGASPHTLTLAGAAGTGLNVMPGSAVTIGANLTLGGASDTITVNSEDVVSMTLSYPGTVFVTHGALISGSLGGSNGLIKDGIGTLKLTGESQYTGGTTVNAGKLVIESNGTTTHGTLGSGTTVVAGATHIQNGEKFGRSGTLEFLKSATAGIGSIVTNGGSLGFGGNTNFFESSTAGTASFTTNGGIQIAITTQGVTSGNTLLGLSFNTGGFVRFYGNSTAGNATFMTNGATVPGGSGGNVIFHESSTAANATFLTNGGTVAGAGGAILSFYETASAGSANITLNGGTTTGAAGGNLRFYDHSSAGHASLTANGGTGGGGGGSIWFLGSATGTTGPVTVNGNASLDLSFSGGGVAIGSLAGDGYVFLAPSTLTVGSNNQSTTFSGTIRDDGYIPSSGGSLTKVGTGTLTLSGANTYTGGTTLSAGTLAAGHAKAFGNGGVSVYGGTLRTTGGPLALDIGAGNFFLAGSNFRSTVFFSGVPTEVLLPNVFGGSTFIAQIGGTVPGVTHDQIKTTGMAEISGKLALVQLNGFHLALGDKVVLVSALGGVLGGSANGTALPGANVEGLAAFSNRLLLVPVVNLYTTSVVLELMQGSFIGLAGTLNFTPNQIAIAGALDSLLAQTGGKTGVIKELDFLDSLPSSLIAANLDLLNPAALTSTSNLAAALANVQSANIQQRLASLRGSDSGGGASSGAPGGGGGGGVNGPQGARGNAVAPANEDRWGLWMTGSGNFVHIGSTTNGAGLNLDSGGVTAGVDYRFTDHFAAGISIGYMNTDASLPNGGKLDVDGGSIGAYATYFNRGLHLDASVSGGPNGYTTRRTTPGNTAATASPRGTAVNVLFAAGYDWKWKALTLGPTASFQYTNVQLDGFTERGAFAPLSVAARDSESLRTSLGFRVALDKKIGRTVLRPEVRAAWQHEHGDASHSLTASFATLGGAPFTVTGPATGRDSLLLGAGFSIQWSERFATYAFYDAELFRTNYSSNNISVGFRWQF